ncbi:hypothetical protein L1887_05945 [Cichorium endivia]|nr:hypothetical protein L1887_05945 [Cichorium endivia]
MADGGRGRHPRTSGKHGAVQDILFEIRSVERDRSKPQSYITMVLWEIALGTAYFLGLKRTYRLALHIQRRLVSSKSPKIVNSFTAIIAILVLNGVEIPPPPSSGKAHHRHRLLPRHSYILVLILNCNGWFCVVDISLRFEVRADDIVGSSSNGCFFLQWHSTMNNDDGGRIERWWWQR